MTTWTKQRPTEPGRKQYREGDDVFVGFLHESDRHHKQPSFTGISTRVHNKSIVRQLVGTLEGEWADIPEPTDAEPPAATEPSERDRDLASKIRQHPATPYCVAEEIARHLAPERQQHAAEVERLTAENAELRLRADNLAGKLKAANQRILSLDGQAKSLRATLDAAKPDLSIEADERAATPRWSSERPKRDGLWLYRDKREAFAGAVTQQPGCSTGLYFSGHCVHARGQTHGPVDQYDGEWCPIRLPVDEQKGDALCPGCDCVAGECDCENCPDADGPQPEPAGQPSGDHVSDSGKMGAPPAAQPEAEKLPRRFRWRRVVYNCDNWEVGTGVGLRFENGRHFLASLDGVTSCTYSEAGFKTWGYEITEWID